MAAILEKYPYHFPALGSQLPMNNPDAAVREVDRATDELGATGVQIFTKVGGRALDNPEYQPVFERMAHHDRPIWMHPARSAGLPDYVGDDRSKYDLW